MPGSRSASWLNAWPLYLHFILPYSEWDQCRIISFLSFLLICLLSFFFFFFFLFFSFFFFFFLSFPFFLEVLMAPVQSISQSYLDIGTWGHNSTIQQHVRLINRFIDTQSWFYCWREWNLESKLVDEHVEREEASDYYRHCWNLTYVIDFNSQRMYHALRTRPTQDHAYVDAANGNILCSHFIYLVRKKM